MERRLVARPVPLTDEIRAAIQPSIERDGHDWAIIEGWFADEGACVWEIGDGLGYVVTVAWPENVIDAILCGGRAARFWIEPLEAAVRAFPPHRGQTLRIEARRGWKRLLPHWNATDLPDGNVLLTSEVC